MKSKTQAKARPQKLHIRKGDNVVVIAGKSRDRKTPRQVLDVNLISGKITVEGVNVMKDTPNKRAQQGQGEQGIVEKPMPIDASNVMLVDPKSGQPTRVRRVKDAEGKSQRQSIKSGEMIGV